MTPQNHLAWFADNIDWFEQIPLDAYDVAVPACNGWTVETVVNHLSFGLGLGYSVAVSKPPDTPDDEAFAGIAWPERWPTGPDAQVEFSRNMRNCLDVFRSLDASTPAVTYAGPGVAGFWFRRACVETTLHRDDVAEALPSLRIDRPIDRTVDAIAETMSFALPLGASLVGQPAGSLVVRAHEMEPVRVGSGEPVVEITGTCDDLLAALWGRHRDRVMVDGDAELAAEWLSLVERAFAGR